MLQVGGDANKSSCGNYRTSMVLQMITTLENKTDDQCL